MLIKRLGSALIIVPVMAISIWAPGTASAVSASDFNAGRIIDDTIFYNSNAMDAWQIQQFLDAKVPTCDTNGTNGNYSYYYNSTTGEVNNGGSWVTTTRAVYGNRLADWGGEWRGSRPPFVCLKSKTFDTSNIAADNYCNGYAGAFGETAAVIIHKVAKSCGINPQVLLVTLQKEQSLITDVWPFGIQYDKAMGYSCPDNPPAEWAPQNCNPDYLGFHKQVYYSARRFKVYQTNPNSYNYVAGRNNQIPWHPNTAVCGYSTVYIQNQATAALYIYTPYRPNQAALDNMYGTGDGCSSYGIRNFWRLFHDWFGSTLGYTIVPELADRYEELGGVNGIMGISTNGGYCLDDRSACWQQYAHGYIVYTPSTGAWESRGGIRNRWGAMGYQYSKMGWPTGPETYSNGIWSQTYQNGEILGTTSTGFWESTGAIRVRWAQLDYGEGVMGIPIGPEVSGPGGSWWQQYAHGYIVYTPSTGAWESRGGIREYWATLGYQNGVAGWPTGPEVYDAESQTWSQSYQNGTIFYSKTAGAEFVAN